MLLCSRTRNSTPKSQKNFKFPRKTKTSESDMEDNAAYYTLNLLAPKKTNSMTSSLGTSTSDLADRYTTHVGTRPTSDASSVLEMEVNAAYSSRPDIVTTTDNIIYEIVDTA